MTTRELYINGMLVDLADRTNVAITKQANNIAELQNRQGDFSNQFKLPYTPTNRAALEHSHIINASTLLPYRQLTARYLEDGIELVHEGTALLGPPDSEGYTVQVIGGNNSFFGKFADLKVSELIGDRYDHVNSFANITASRSATTGYIYPLINWYDDTDPGAFMDEEIDPRFLLPVIFIKDIFALVDELTGYSSSGRLMQLPDFDNLILTPNALQRGPAAQEQYNVDVSGVTPGTVATTPITFANDAGNFVASEFIADAPIFGYMGLKTIVQITNSSGSTQSGFLNFEVLRNAGVEVFFTMVIPFTLLAGQSAEFYGSDFSVNRLFVPADTYTVTCEVISATGITYSSAHTWSFSLINELPYGALMPVGELYEGITVKQVYQDVMNLYASIPQTNSFRGEAVFGLFEQLTENIPLAKNWSSKIQPKGHQLGYKFGKYGKTNYMKYAATETVTPGYGDSSFAIDDETLPDIVTAVELATSATEDAIGYQNVPYPRIKSLETARKFTATAHRILLLDRKDTPYTHTYDDGTDTLTTGNDIPYATFRPLAFDVLKEIYYPTLLGMLFKTKAPAYNVQLTRQDVQELDFLIPVYLDVHREDIDVTAYFYVSRVGNYLNGFARVELVRL